MTLYRVDLAYTLYVLADGERLAEDIAKDHIDEEVPFEIEASKVRGTDTIGQGWQSALPWGESETEETVGQLHAAIAQAEAGRTP